MDSTFILNILSLLYPVKSDGDTAVVLPMTMKVYKNIITAECGGDFAVVRLLVCFIYLLPKCENSD